MEHKTATLFCVVMAIISGHISSRINAEFPALIIGIPFLLITRFIIKKLTKTENTGSWTMCFIVVWLVSWVILYNLRF